MPAEKIVLNASPLILLCNCELSFVLPALFSDLEWLIKIRTHPMPDVVRWDLGLGETEVLSFAVKYDDYTPVLDDMLAKKCARSLGIQTIGTGAILILAKEHGMIESVELSLRKLQQAGLWISEPIIQMLMRKAGE